MKRLIALSGISLALLAGGPAALAQSSPPALPALTPQQSTEVQQRLDLYRRQTEGRVARGDISADEADRLMNWRSWQIARQVAGIAPSPPPTAMGYDAVPPDYHERHPQDYVVEPPRYYSPYYAPPYYAPYYAPPYYSGPRPYYWGPAVCAGGFGRHFGGRICF